MGIKHGSFGDDSNMPILRWWKNRRTKEELLTEYNDRAEWGMLYFIGPSNVHHESGAAILFWQRFVSTGTLRSSVDSGFGKS